MPAIVVKVNATEDLYLRFSTVADDITDVGTRHELMTEASVPEWKLRAADERGTSAGCKCDGCGRSSLSILDPKTREPGWYRLHRRDFKRYALLFREAKYAEAELLLELEPEIEA